MHNRIFLVSVTGGLAVILAWFLIDQYAAGFLFIIALTLVFSMLITADAAKNQHPQIFASLDNDARTIIVENLGTGPASGVKVRIIPDDTGYDIGTLAPDDLHRHELPSSVREAKAGVSWDIKDGGRTEKIFRLSGYAEETDSFRPMFPIFSWKGK
jgi:hypothetical protein